jgi:hypothetical protein
MAFGRGEDPSQSVGGQLEGIAFPVWQEALVRFVAENEAPPDVINLFKALPRGKYESRDEVMRDLAEAARRFATGHLPDDDGAPRDRRNLGRDAVEGAEDGRTRHP